VGITPELLKELPGYDPDIAKNRAEARRIMQKLGYGPAKSLPIKISARYLPPARNTATLLIDQLKQIDIDGELEIIDTSLYYPKMLRKDFTVGVNAQPGGPDPDPTLDALYGCGSSVNWDHYCNPEVDKMIEQQSMESDTARRKQILWAIERKLAEDFARPIIYYNRFATCWQPWVKGPTMTVDSGINSNRREDWWLDK
jgi:peptide/nickel transport system substrate-binding protein